MLSWIKNLFFKPSQEDVKREIVAGIEAALDKCLREGFASCDPPCPMIAFKKAPMKGPVVEVVKTDSIKNCYHLIGMAEVPPNPGRAAAVMQLVEAGFDKLRHEDETLRSWGFRPFFSPYRVTLKNAELILLDDKYFSEYSCYVLPCDGRKKIAQVQKEDLVFKRIKTTEGPDLVDFVLSQGQNRPEREFCVRLSCGGMTARVWPFEDPLPPTLSFVAHAFSRHFNVLPEGFRSMLVESELVDLKPYTGSPT